MATSKKGKLTGFDKELSKMSPAKQRAYAKLIADANTQANMGAAPGAKKRRKK